mgnify:CR=1 FL=1
MLLPAYGGWPVRPDNFPLGWAVMGGSLLTIKGVGVMLLPITSAGVALRLQREHEIGGAL